MAPQKRAAIETRAAQTRYGEGLYWQASRADGTITLFGTYHLPHAETQAHFDRLLPRAQAADIVYFEMAAPDIDRFQRAASTRPDVIFNATGPTLPEQLEEDEWQTLRTRLAERGFPGFMAAKLKPIFVSMMLGLSPCQMRRQQSGAKGIDHALAEFLHAEGRDTRSIEDYLTTLKVFDAFSREEQIDMLRLALDLPLDPDDMAATMFNAYADGKTALLWELGRSLSIEYGGPTAEADFAKFERVLLTERNHAWHQVLRQEAPGRDVFVAVGAAHLPGPDGLLTLLEGDGYTITPLSFD